MHAMHMPSAMRFLLETHSTNVCARDGARVRALGAHTFIALERPLVEMHHRNMSIESVTKCETAIARLTSMVALFEMRDSVMLIGITTLGKGLVADLACERLDLVRGARVREQLVARGRGVGAVLAAERGSGGGDGEGAGEGGRGWLRRVRVEEETNVVLVDGERRVGWRAGHCERRGANDDCGASWAWAEIVYMGGAVAGCGWYAVRRNVRHMREQLSRRRYYAEWRGRWGCACMDGCTERNNDAVRCIAGSRAAKPTWQARRGCSRAIFRFYCKSVMQQRSFHSNWRNSTTLSCINRLYNMANRSYALVSY